MTCEQAVQFVGSHHYGPCPVGVLFVDDGYGNGTRTGNIAAAIAYVFEGKT